jgi:Uma2 family endonuclease
MAADPARALDDTAEPNPPLAEALYANPPEGVEVEILHRTILMAPAPRARHQRAGWQVATLLAPPFDRGRGGPGGWVFVPEPRLELGARPDKVRPDVAAWRRERMPEVPDAASIVLVPDWVCEVLSPSTEVIDRGVKVPTYAEHGVRWLWLVDPAAQTVEAFALETGALRPVGTWRGAAVARVPPFDAVALELADLWAR